MQKAGWLAVGLLPQHLLPQYQHREDRRVGDLGYWQPARRAYVGMDWRLFGAVLYFKAAPPDAAADVRLTAVVDTGGRAERGVAASRSRRHRLEVCPPPVRPEPAPGAAVIWVAAAGVAVNTVTALLFCRGQEADVNIRGAYLHIAADAAVSAGVVLSGVVMQ